MFTLDQLDVPIVQAPLAGGASTPELAAAVASAGGLGFLAAGYKAPEAVRADIAPAAGAERPAVRRQPVRAAGSGRRPGRRRGATRASLRRGGACQGVALGEPRHDDDGWEQKLALVIEERVPVVSFTFGCPTAATVQRLHDAGARSG